MQGRGQFCYTSCLKFPSITGGVRGGSLPVQLKGLLDNIVFQIYATLHTGHGLHQTGPVLFRQPLPSAEARPQADIADVARGVVLGAWCPASHDVGHTDSLIPSGIGAQDAAGSANTPLQGVELDELPVCLYCALSHPLGFCNPPYVQRVAVSHSSGHGATRFPG